jgi:hypothetical protein
VPEYFANAAASFGSPSNFWCGEKYGFLSGNQVSFFQRWVG